MTAVAELDLPLLDLNDPTLRGERFHAVMHQLREQGWLAALAARRATCSTARRPPSSCARSRRRSRGRRSPRSSASRTARCARRSTATSCTSTATTTGACATSSTPPSPRARPTAGGRRCAASSSSCGPPLGDATSCDFLDAFAKPYPSLMIATVMGAPLEDAPRLEHWSNWIQRQFDAPSLMTDAPRSSRPSRSSTRGPTSCSPSRRDDPSDDLVSTLIAAEQEGDRLSDVELVNLVLNVLVGGVDTTQSQLAQAHPRCSPRHPDQWDAARREPRARAEGGGGDRSASSRSRRSRRGSCSRTSSTATCASPGTPW